MNLKNIFLTICLIFIASDNYCQEIGKVVPAKTIVKSTSVKANEFYNQALDNFDEKNFKKAVELNKLAIAEDTNFIDAYDNLGLAYRKLNMLDSATYYYLYSFKKDTTNTTAIQNLAAVAELRNDIPKAELLYLLITSMEPENPEGYFGLARMEYLQGKKEEAFKNAQSAEKYYKKINSPFIGDCYYILCMICADMRNITIARQYLKLAKQAGLDIDPKLEDALK